MHISLHEVGGQTLRVGIRPGEKARPPLLLFNGIGASIELVAPFLAALEGPEAIVFDVPGVGGSPAPSMPYRPSTLARLAAQLLDQLGHDQVDVLGVSWGGALAQQFAFAKASRPFSYSSRRSRSSSRSSSSRWRPCCATASTGTTRPP